MTDIAQRLLDFENEGITSSDRYHLRSEAAAEIGRLRAALKPFAEAKVYDGNGALCLERGDDLELAEFASNTLKLGHLSDARRAYQQQIVSDGK